MAKFRIGRVKQEIMREVNDILMKKVRDPRVEGVTLTDIEVTRDLQHATIYYTTLDKLASERQATVKGLEKAKGLIRRELGKRLSLFKVPEVHFERDESVDYGLRIDSLLDQIHSEYMDKEEANEVEETEE
ncbi:ribosome-binding factor A [Granulicatella balaenopterae]|uniref:Ribosome-binding factor A n=1 Tax=Granulicatella balaenopterae TaxID=137733 RepID=A0A1H9L743_9LACT|nr:30S ribosome-binding factor RbfA [Granulicatella balaenopterae]SER06813.1 ribosome-binding factor A [Granulicatella balaenopterae]